MAAHEARLRMAAHEEGSAMHHHSNTESTLAEASVAASSETSDRSGSWTNCTRPFVKLGESGGGRM